MYSKTCKAAGLSAFIGLAVIIQGGIAAAAGSHGSGHGAAKHGSAKAETGMKHEGGKSHGQEMEIGAPGEAGQVDRTITVVMGDNYFEPEEIKVRKGETIRFIVRNDGAFLHEFNIGTAAMHAAHQEEMANMAIRGMITPTAVVRDKMKMEHDDGKMAIEHNDPNSILLAPGKQQEIVWRFTKVVALEYGCNLPGHYEAGMMGPIHVMLAPSKTS